MYIAYSALQNQIPQPETNNQTPLTADQLQTRHQAYQTICSKYRREIADIQKYIPGWQPSPPTS